MLYGADADIPLCQDRSALGVDHILGDGIDGGLALEVNPLNLVPGVLRCRIEGRREAQSCVKSFPEEGEAPFQCFLLDSVHVCISDISLFPFRLEAERRPELFAGSRGRYRSPVSCLRFPRGAKLFPVSLSLLACGRFVICSFSVLQSLSAGRSAVCTSPAAAGRWPAT